MKKLFLFWPVFILFAVPVWADQAEIAGVYVKCPPKDETGCTQVSDDFRRRFPNNHNAPFMLIRKDGRGYLAPDERLSTDFTWQFQNPDLIILKMNDKSKSKVEYQIIGPRLVSDKHKETYLLSISDAEWNPEPQLFKNKAKSLSGANK